jgi:hypothetical protein
MCLAYPQRSETAWGRPNLKAGRKPLVTIEPIGGRPSFAFHLQPAEVDRLFARRAFFATPYGRGGGISLWTGRAVDWRAVSELVDRSYRVVARRRMLAALDAKE